MIELVLCSAVAFVAGILVANWRHGSSLLDMKEALAKKDSLLKARIAQLKSFRRSQVALKDAWKEVAEGLSLPDPHRRLLTALGQLLPELPVPEDPTAPVETRSLEQRESIAYIDALVREVDQYWLSELWRRRSFVALHEMVSALVAQAPAANNSDFGALGADMDPKHSRG